MSSFTRQQLEKWVGEIEVPAGVRVLDVGGAQKPVRGRTKTWGISAQDYEILDLDIPHEIDVSVGEYRRLDIQKRGLIGDRFYDILFCLEVSEYWYDPFTALKNLGQMLVRGGTLYISFHFIYPPHAPAGKDYLRYTGEGVKRLLIEAGFDHLVLTPRLAKYPEVLASFYQTEGMKKLNNAPDVVGWLVEAKKI